jgi:hypothetical protein
MPQVSIDQAFHVRVPDIKGTLLALTPSVIHLSHSYSPMTPARFIESTHETIGRGPKGRQDLRPGSASAERLKANGVEGPASGTGLMCRGNRSSSCGGTTTRLILPCLRSERSTRGFSPFPETRR